MLVKKLTSAVSDLPTVSISIQGFWKGLHELDLLCRNVLENGVSSAACECTPSRAQAQLDWIWMNLLGVFFAKKNGNGNGNYFMSEDSKIKIHTKDKNIHTTKKCCCLFFFF